MGREDPPPPEDLQMENTKQHSQSGEGIQVPTEMGKSSSSAHTSKLLSLAGKEVSCLPSGGGVVRVQGRTRKGLACCGHEISRPLGSGPACSSFSLDRETWRLGAWDMRGQSYQRPDAGPDLLLPAGVDLLRNLCYKAVPSRRVWGRSLEEDNKVAGLGWDWAQ